MKAAPLVAWSLGGLQRASWLAEISARACSHYLRPSIWLHGLRQKVVKCYTFQAVPDPSANQIAVMQTHFPGSILHNKPEEARRIWPFIFKEMWSNRIVFSHLLFVSSFELISTHRLCSITLQRLIPYTSDTPSAIRQRTHVV